MQEFFSKYYYQFARQIKSLNNLQNIHTDLNPDNIVQNFKPFKVVIIDFDQVKLNSSNDEEPVCGRLDYFPDRRILKEGINQLDV